MLLDGDRESECLVDLVRDSIAGDMFKRHVAVRPAHPEEVVEAEIVHDRRIGRVHVVSVNIRNQLVGVRKGHAFGRQQSL